MSKLFFIIALLLVACTNDSSLKQTKRENEHDQHDTVTANAPTLQLNNGSKWKTDQATRRNVAAMIQVVNDTSYTGYGGNTQLAIRLQERVDSLVRQCTMKGPDHEALHGWLEIVLVDLKGIKETDQNKYRESYVALKKDVESFYTFFD